MSQPTGALKPSLARPRRASRAPSRLGDENLAGPHAVPRLIAKAPAAALSRPGLASKSLASTSVSVGVTNKASATVAVGGPRRALGDVSNAGRTAVDRTSKDSLAAPKPARSRTHSASSNPAPQPPSSTGTGLSRLKIHNHPSSGAAVTVSSKPSSRPVSRVPVVRGWKEESVGLGIEGTEMHEVEEESHKRGHEEYEDESDDGVGSKVRILGGELEDLDDWMAEAEEEESKMVLAGIKDEFDETYDFWDPTMVAEYNDEIFEYMAELEEKAMPNPRYMDHQTEIEWAMRTTLIDWLLQVHMRYHMLPETLWIAINIIDRFLSNRVVSLVKFQLVGVTAMFIAAKYEEIMAPSVEEFVFMTEGGYTRDEILKGERIILQSLDFNISSYCSPYSWVRRISKADDYDIQTRTLSKFLMEVTLLDHRFLRAKPSMIAAMGMYLARRMLGGEWNESFTYYSNYTEAQLLTPAGFLLESIGAPEFDEKFVYKKYANKKFLKASIFARNWTRNNVNIDGTGPREV